MTKVAESEFLRFAGATDDLRHGISTRPWNVSFSAGIRHGDPIEGRRRLLEFAGIDARRTAIAGQVHGDGLRWVTSGDCGPGVLVKGHAIVNTDALATTERGVGLLVTAADCPPVLVWDPRQTVVAVIHSGWRGTALEILVKTVSELCARAGVHSQDLHVAIGPGIGACCYEVGDEVSERVPARFRQAVLRAERGVKGRSRLDLRAWISAQALEAGIAPEHLQQMDLCTSCRRELFFSHRGEAGDCGRFGLVAAIR